MELIECSICFESYHILAKFKKCKHEVCMNCFPKIKLCPFCRNPDITASYDNKYLIKILTENNELNSIFNEIIKHPNIQYNKLSIKLSKYFSKYYDASKSLIFDQILLFLSSKKYHVPYRYHIIYLMIT